MAELNMHRMGERAFKKQHDTLDDNGFMMCYILFYGILNAVF